MKKGEFSNMPISNAVYGTDHPSKRPPHPPGQRREHGSWIVSRLDERTQKRLARKYPRIRKYLNREAS